MKPLALLLALFCLPAFAQTPAAANKYRGILTREAHFMNGLNAPVPMYAAQLEQESGFRPGIIAFDGGVGLAQFMAGTADDIYKLYPDLGKPAPANPVWAIRALVRYDTWLTNHVLGDDDCQRRAAALKSYNAGIGYVLQAQKKSAQPGIWFGVTELVPTKQSPKNFEASRLYPRWILIDRQPHYRGWGSYTCEGVS